MPTEEEKQRILDRLKEMNRKLSELIEQWDGLTEGQRYERRDDLVTLKGKLVRDLGIDPTFYSCLHYMDLWFFLAGIGHLDNAPKRYIGNAKREKERLEKVVNELWPPG